MHVRFRSITRRSSPGVSRWFWSVAAIVGIAAPWRGTVLAQGGASTDTTTAAAGARPISLADAIALARRNSPQAVQARSTERTNRALARSAVGAFIPSLSVSAGAVRRFDNGRTSGQVTTGTGTIINTSANAWTYSNGFSVSSELFNPQNIPNLRAARANVIAAQATEVTQNYAVALAVAQQYYAALSARESEDAARAALAQAQEQLTASVRQYHAGAATRSDSLRSFVQVANARVTLLQAHTNLRSADATLTRLIGSATVVTAMPADTAESWTLDGAPADSATIVRFALAGPSVLEARAALAAADARRSAARATYLPTLGASYSRSGSGTDSRFGIGPEALSYNGQLNISLSYSIFNGFGREAQNVQADAALDNAQAVLRDAELAARQLAVQDWDALETGREQVAAQRAAMTAAEEDLRVQRARYDIGMSTLLDVLTSQAQLNQARFNLISARYNLRVARAQIESLIGRSLTPATSAGPSSSSTPQRVP